MVVGARIFRALSLPVTLAWSSRTSSATTRCRNPSRWMVNSTKTVLLPRWTSIHVRTCSRRAGRLHPCSPPLDLPPKHHVHGKLLRRSQTSRKHSSWSSQEVHNTQIGRNSKCRHMCNMAPRPSLSNGHSTATTDREHFMPSGASLSAFGVTATTDFAVAQRTGATVRFGGWPEMSILRPELLGRSLVPLRRCLGVLEDADGSASYIGIAAHLLGNLGREWGLLSLTEASARMIISLYVSHIFMATTWVMQVLEGLKACKASLSQTMVVTSAY
jgi:hypothetical protein